MMKSWDLKHGPKPARGAQAAAAPFNNGYAELPEQGAEQQRAAREWLRHVEKGRIGGRSEPKRTG
jgi:hypothetical protein